MKLRQAFCGMAVAVCLAAAPAWAKDSDALDAKITEFNLPNGLHVILSEDHTVPMVATNIWYLVGSANETKGHTGFAHLFEHLMFCGSGHVGKGQFDSLLESVGGNNNASTSEDRTNYYITVPSNALPLALFLESDRMGYLLDNMRANIVDEQRDVVKNELRERYLNTPYNKVYMEIPSIMYPEGHPYSWPVIGSLEDLTAAKYDDVVAFFKEHYVPGNASLAIVGDFKTPEVKKMVEYWFSDVPKGQVPPRVNAASEAELQGVVKRTITDKVDLPRRMILWHSPAEFAEGDAALDVLSAILSGSKNSRLYKRLLYDNQIAQSADAMQMSQKLGSLYCVDFMARPGHTLDEIQAIVDEEIERISKEPPTQKEMELAVNGIEYNFYRLIEKDG
ncbi:insulinase family protein, partial [bacterium]|nr:insulinase family protein [bacterium]